MDRPLRRYSGANMGVLTACVNAECTSSDVRSTDILGYQLDSGFRIGGLREKNWDFVGAIDEVFICDWPLPNLELYKTYISYFRSVPLWSPRHPDLVRLAFFCPLRFAP